MLEKLINNFTLLTTFLFFGNLLRIKSLTWIEDHSTLRKLIEGAIFGIFGVLLIYYSFPITDCVRADTRQLALLVSVYLGGWMSGLVTMLILLVYRLFFVHGFNDYALAGAINILITWAAALGLISKGKLKFRRWGAALLITAGLNASALYTFLGEPGAKAAPAVTVYYLFCGLLLYLMIRYMKRSQIMMQMMKEDASRDHLTGLYNTRSLEAYLEHKSDSSEFTDSPFSMLVIDIDHFKTINDTYGHAAGDAVLVQFAEVLTESFRSGDYIARKGGEEFVVIVERCGADKVGQVAEKLRMSVQHTPFALQEGKQITLTVSVGTASYPQTACMELFEQADRLLYKAKNSGRNRVCVN